MWEVNNKPIKVEGGYLMKCERFEKCGGVVVRQTRMLSSKCEECQKELAKLARKYHRMRTFRNSRLEKWAYMDKVWGADMNTVQEARKRLREIKKAYKRETIEYWEEAGVYIALLEDYKKHAAL